MPEPFNFTDTLQQYVTRTAYTPGQLATLTGLPRTTIVNWLNGRVQRPRDWQPIVKLLTVLHLTESEADEILQAANQPTIAELRLIARQEHDQGLLRAWHQSTAPPPPSPTYRPPFQAVPDTPYFVGRHTILSQLKNHLLSRDTAICVLQGMAGTGKTAVAAHLAYQLRPHFPDGVLWARLDTSDAMATLHTFAQAYGADASQYADIASRSRIVRDLLADKRALIILDNALDSTGVEPLLPPTGQCAVLITTRRHDLRVAQGANRFTLLPFRANSEASRQLFAHFLGPEQATADALSLAAIAEYVGHLPLALAIVAARLAYEPGWSAVEFLARLQQTSRRLKELQSEDQNVRLSFAASYELAPEEVQLFFATLSRFGGKDFSPEAAAAAADLEPTDAQDYLRTLYRLSLVQSGQSGRYQLHPLLRDYARDQLSGSIPWSPLTSYFTTFLKKHSLGDMELSLESDNISAVITGALENGETAAAIDLLIAFVPYLRIQGMYTAAQQQLTRALNSAEDDQRLPILLYLSQIARFYRRYEEADSYLVSAVPLAQQQEDSYHQSAIEAEKGIIADCRGDFRSARSHFQAGLALARRHNRLTMLIPLLKELGVAQVQFGNYDIAETHYQEALALAQPDAPHYTPMLLRCLGSIAYIRDRDIARAELLYKEALHKAQAINSREDMVPLFNNLAVMASLQGQTAEAKERLQEGLTLARALFHQGGLGMILSNLGRLALNGQDWETAETYLQEALSVATTAQHHETINAVGRTFELLAQNRQGNQQLERLKIIFD
ncbi:MAG: tetratricopeptide repeat protein [Candidatus Promineifilaceae bacterium]